MMQTSNTMINLEGILCLNNDAVKHLCQGSHSASTSTLREAIKSLEKCFRVAKEASSTRTPSSSSSSSPEPPRKRRRQNEDANKEKTVVGSSYVPVKLVNISDSELAPPKTAFEDTTALLNIYDRAFEFPSVKEEDIGFSTQQSKTRLAAILLYNLGLTYHREGMRNGTSKDLNSALKFYREAYMVLKTAWANTDFQEVFVLLLALLNNMSCIHAVCFDVTDAHQCIEWMNKALCSRQRSLLTKTDFTFFSLNLSVFRGHQLRYAAAA